MYTNTVTIFNNYESSTASIWYPHVIHNVDLITDKGAMLKKYGPNSTDAAELHIVYADKDGKKVITDAAGNPLPWLPPKEWRNQVNDLLSGSITFGPDDFFMAGEWDEAPVNDDEYRGFYNYMNSRFDFVFKISSVGGPYSVIPHFEILGK